MNLPPIKKGLPIPMGADALTSAPINRATTLDFNIEIDNKNPKKSKSITFEKCLKLFGARETLMMNFIPQMLTALALEQAEAFIRYCGDNRLSDYKRYNREMRKCIDEYNYELRRSYGPSWYVYQVYLDRLRKALDVDLFKCWCTFTNEAARQLGNDKREISARVALIRMILTFVEDFDKNMDKVISERINAPCNRKRNPYILLISVLCMDMAETFDQQMQVTSPMTLCVKVLANRCHSVVDAIMHDEDAHS